MNRRSKGTSVRRERDLGRLIETCKTLDQMDAGDESELFEDYQRAVEVYASRYRQSVAEVEQTVLCAVVL